MIQDKKVRVSITKESFYYFFHFYYAHYVKYPTADFQKEIMHLLEKDPTENLFVVAFRGSGKSTIITTAYPIWSILGKQQKKFVLIFCQTKAQAKQHMMNLRRELEDNDVLKKDLGPFQEESDEWGSHSLVFSNSEARITLASTEQSVRGLRHHQHRPDLIICDDVEDITSSKTREGRDKIYNWLRGEIIPAGDKQTRLVIVGNLLHEDSLLMRIKEDVENDRANGNFKKYPLLDEKDNCLWLGKYPTPADIEIEKKKIGNEISWQREFLLRIIPDEDQLIDSSIIQYYDELPPKTHKAYRCTYASVDLAISKGENADYTAVVSAMIFGRRDKMRIFILPNPIVKRLNFPEQINLMKTYYETVLDGRRDRLFVEGIGYQDALPQMLETYNIKAEAVRPSVDKRTRLALTVPYIQSAKVLFPRKGAEDIIREIIGFGVEKHDDIADAFSMLINKIAEIHSNEPTWLMSWIGGDTVYYSDYIDVEAGREKKVTSLVNPC